MVAKNKKERNHAEAIINPVPKKVVHGLVQQRHEHGTAVHDGGTAVNAVVQQVKA